MLEPKEVYATAHVAGVAGCYKDLACVRRQIDEDLARLVPAVDIAIPFFHWGKEGSYEVRDYQVELAHHCIERGCKAVLGAHPHRLQGVEVHHGAPIFYSLGNFVYGGIKEPSDTLTMIARMAFDGANVNAEVIPLRFTNWPDKPFQPYVLEHEARDMAMQRIAELSSSFGATLPQLAPYRVARQAVAPVRLAPADTLETGAPR
jgi:poly-gamma-glutamate synthesis protein (capsule biosynthesis protein)